MIKILVKTNSVRREVVSDIEKTPKSVFEDLGISTSGSVVNLNGTILSATDMNSTFKNLGAEDGNTVNLNSIVKADGANK